MPRYIVDMRYLDLLPDLEILGMEGNVCKLENSASDLDAHPMFINTFLVTAELVSTWDNDIVTYMLEKNSFDACVKACVNS